ncbi:MAG: hypothetical protein NT062_11180 [Proteobacteria bacterium]|nr:hypothetical protein [Pseudomonadota bacterium]
MVETSDVPGPVRTLASKLAAPKPMRRGSVSERFVKCNKAGCACAEDPKARHGPYVSWVRGVGGKTQSRWISAAQATELRAQVEAGQEFRRDLESFWQACEAWADAELAEPEAASDEAAKKGGSMRASVRKSSEKSRR